MWRQQDHWQDCQWYEPEVEGNDWGNGDFEHFDEPYTPDWMNYADSPWNMPQYFEQPSSFSYQPEPQNDMRAQICDLINESISRHQPTMAELKESCPNWREQLIESLRDTVPIEPPETLPLESSELDPLDLDGREQEFAIPFSFNDVEVDEYLSSPQDFENEVIEPCDDTLESDEFLFNFYVQLARDVEKPLNNLIEHDLGANDEDIDCDQPFLIDSKGCEMELSEEDEDITVPLESFDFLGVAIFVPRPQVVILDYLPWYFVKGIRIEWMSIKGQIRQGFQNLISGVGAPRVLVSPSRKHQNNLLDGELKMRLKIP